MTNNRIRSHRLRALLAAAVFSPAIALANPSGEVVRHGQATFERGPGGLTVMTGSNRTIIEWADFSIGAGERTNFIQPGVSSSTLNRVTGGLTSRIDGLLESNGQLLLINPNGIVVGPSGTVRAAGFIASTLDVSDDDFLAGGDMTFLGDSQAPIVNHGSIEAIGGDVFLFARHIENHGLLSAPDGQVGLGAGAEVLLKASGEERVFVKPSGSGEGGTGITNTGTIEAATAELKAHGNLYALAINNSGTVRATSATKSGGRIFLSAPGGAIDNSGTLAAKQGASGGEVTIEADQILNAGTIDAAGLGAEDLPPDSDLATIAGQSGTGGGSVAVEGERRVTLAPGSLITAAGGADGAGGEIRVRSMGGEKSATFFLPGSQLDAAGGTAGGDAGFIDVSSAGGAVFEGGFDLSAADGSRGGSLLIDPRDTYFEAANPGGRTSIPGGAPAPGDAWDPDALGGMSLQEIAFGEYPTPTDLSISPASLGGGRFGPGSTITFQTERDFWLTTDLDIAAATGSSGVGLDVQAGRDINILADITADGTFVGGPQLRFSTDVGGSVNVVAGSGVPQPLRAKVLGGSVGVTTQNGAIHIDTGDLNILGSDTVPGAAAQIFAGGQLGRMTVNATGTMTVRGGDADGAHAFFQMAGDAELNLGGLTLAGGEGGTAQIFGFRSIQVNDIDNQPAIPLAASTLLRSARGNPQKQIFITSKFVEVRLQAQQELGFDWLLGSFNGNAGNAPFFVGGSNGTSGNFGDFNIDGGEFGSPFGQTNLFVQNNAIIGGSPTGATSLNAYNGIVLIACGDVIVGRGGFIQTMGGTGLVEFGGEFIQEPGGAVGPRIAIVQKGTQPPVVEPGGPIDEGQNGGGVQMDTGGGIDSLIDMVRPPDNLAVAGLVPNGPKVSDFTGIDTQSAGPGVQFTTVTVLHDPEFWNRIKALPEMAGFADKIGGLQQVSNSATPGIFALGGVFTDPEFQVVIRALNQRKGSDLMTAPSIVTSSGQRAKIEIIREFIYPTEYDPPEIPQTFGSGGFGGGGFGGGGGNFSGSGGFNTFGGFPVTPANPTPFDVRNVGVTLDVDPVVGPDGFTIELNIAPEVVEFEGFINYGSPIRTSAVNALGQPTTVVLTESRIQQPIFATRKLSTEVTIFDGQTVAIGGLIREDISTTEDKVPFFGDVPLVGRFFKQDEGGPSKRNLTIFVTATLVDPAGTR